MIALDPPLKSSLYDPFSGSVVDRRYAPLGADSGTTILAGGVATLALAAGDPDTVRNQALAWLAAADVLKASLKITAHDLADPHIGSDRRAAGLLVFTDSDNVDFVGVVNDGAGLAIGADSVRDGVLTLGPRVAYTEGLVSVRAERDGADLVLHAAIGDEAEQVVATIADFPEAPAKAAVLLQTDKNACQASFDDFRVESAARIERVSDIVFGCHLAPRLIVEGSGLPAGLIAGYMPPDWSEFEAAQVTVNAAGTRAEIVLPLQVAPALKLLWFGLGEDIIFMDPLRLKISDTGYWIIRRLLPPGRYTAPADNPFFVRVAGMGQALDRLDAAGRALYGEEIFPEEANWTLSRHEDFYGIRPRAEDSMTVRRARVTAMSSRLPSLSVPFLNIIVNALLPGRTVVEQESFADYGAFKWQFQAYEDEPGELPYEDWARLEGDLNAYGPGYAQAAVGHIGFVADDSACERDFCDDGEEE